MSKRILAYRLREAGLGDKRMIQCLPGSKASHDHTLHAPDNVDGNYGIYATAEDRLAIIDIDDYEDVADESGLRALTDLPPTLEQNSPHKGNHRFYSVTETDNGQLIADVLEERLGKKNPKPSWGEVRVANQYVVGAGSQLDGCKKDWCDECATDDGGLYSLNDCAIAEISAEQLVDVLRRDRNYTLDDEMEENEQDTRAHPATDADSAEILAYAFNESDDAKLRRLWNGDYSDYGDDRSAAEAALARKLGWWLQGDKKAVARAMDGHGLSESVPLPRLKKWSERDDDSYRDSVLSAVDQLTEFYEPGRTSEDDGSEVVKDEETGEQRELPKPTHIDGLALNNGGYGEWKTRKDDDGEDEKYFDTSTNFQIEVSSYLYLYDRTYINLTVWPREGEEYHLTGIDPTVFNEKRDFKAHICSGLTTTFSGGEDELNKIKRFVGTQDAPSRTGTHHMGLHGDEWVTPNGVLTADGWEDEPETVYVNRDIGVERKWALNPEDGDEYDSDEVASILELLPQTRDPERLIPALMWFYAAPLRPLIHDWTGQFNLLFVLGETGSGKTTTLETLWQAFGMGGEPLTADDTKFTLLTTLGASNGVPMWFDEYKPSDMADYEVDRFWNEVRKTTRGGVSQRGNADKTTTEYHLHAPTVISGEERVAGSAEERRGIFTTFRKDTTDEHSQTVKRYAQLAGSDYEHEDGTIERFDGHDLSAHALAYYEHVLGIDRDELRAIWRDCAEYVAELLADENVSGLEDLVKQGLQTIKFGATVYFHFADAMGTDVPITAEDVNEAILYVATRSQGGANRKSHLDTFFELSARAARHDYLLEDKHYTFVNEGEEDEELRFNLATGYDKIAKYAREHDVAEDLLNSKDDYRERIKDILEDDKSYVSCYSYPTSPIGRAVGLYFYRASEQLEDFDKTMFADVGVDADDGDLVASATPIRALDGSGNPFYTITVEALTFEEHSDERRPVYTGVFADATGIVELIDWFGCPACDQVEEDGHYLIEDVKVSYDKDGAIQLEPVRNTTKISAIQPGVGHTVSDMPAEGQDQLETATDGGEIESLQGRVLMHFTEASEALNVAPVAGALEEAPDNVQGAIDYLVMKGRLLENEDGSYELP